MNLNSIAKMLSNLNLPPTLKKIKVSPKLYDLIRHLYDQEFIYSISFGSEVKSWRGIPVEIDYDKQDYAYEAVYEENDNE